MVKGFEYLFLFTKLTFPLRIRAWLFHLEMLVTEHGFRLIILFLNLS